MYINIIKQQILDIYAKRVTLICFKRSGNNYNYNNIYIKCKKKFFFFFFFLIIVYC